MGRKRKDPPMTDKERILMNIIQELRTTSALGPAGKPWDSEAYRDDNGGYYVHFAPWIGDDEMQPGTLVICETSYVGPWKIAYLVRRVEYGRWIIREIGTDRLCDMGNEKFVPIIGMSPSQLWEGDQYRFSQKVIQAFALGDEMWYRYGGMEFDADGKATVSVRARYGGMLQFGKHGAKPFQIQISWTPQMTVEEILEVLKAGGYGTRQWEPVDPEDAEPKASTT